MLQKCCCCCSLTTGAIVLGILGLISSAIMIIGCIFGIANIHQVVQALSKEHPDVSTGDVEAIAYAIIGLALVYITLTLITCVFLIMGAVKRRHRYLLPWLYLTAFGLVAYVILNILKMTMSANVGMAFVEFAISLALQLYFFYAVYSLYHEIKDDTPPVRYSGVATNTKR